MAIVTGTIYDDTLPGTSKADLIEGLDGNDTLQGLSGNDTLSGGAGLDDLHGGKGDDRLLGDAGNDLLFGESGKDVLNGGDGYDRLKGGDDDDVMIGGAGRDNLYGGAGRDVFLYTDAGDSRQGDVDIIWDFEHGIDLIDLSALGYTGFTTGHAAANELRLTYSAATDRTYLRDDHSDFEIALKGDYRGQLTDDDFHFRSVVHKVGFYQTAEWQYKYADDNSRPITNLGYQAVRLTDLTPDNLKGLDAMFILNGDWDTYNPAFLAQVPNLADYVYHGGVMIIHDRFADDAELLLPGLTGERIKQNFGTGDQVDFVNPTGPIAHGPGGDVPDGSGSNHGWAFDSTLPDDVVRVITTDDPERVVSFAYAYGAGVVYYSAIPLDFYLTYLSPQPDGQLMEAYAENVLHWAVDGHHDLLAL